MAKKLKTWNVLPQTENSVLDVLMKEYINKSKQVTLMCAAAAVHIIMI